MIAEQDRFDGRRAVVVGASMAGLVAARVLADHFAEVALVERDSWTDDPGSRRGVPQGRQPHVLLRSGELALEALFPGLAPALVAGGATRLLMSRDVRWHQFGVWKLRFDAGIPYLAMSRPFLEAHVRRRVLALPNVTHHGGREVTGLLGRRGTVTGVRLRGDGDGGEARIDADLVVDASGRNTRAPAWLSALGLAPPEESRVRVHVGYATRLYARTEDGRRDWKLLYAIGAPPHGKRSGLVLPIEGDRWMVGLAGIAGDFPPGDPEGFHAFTRGLPTDDVTRLIEAEEPLGGVAVYRFPSDLRRHYERIAYPPEGFVALGDALASFNPVYGQGMTVAALTARALGDALTAQRAARGRGALAGFSRRFQRAAAAVIDGPWALATGEDLRHPEVEGRRPPGFSLTSQYIRRVHEQSAIDEEVARRLFRVLNMLDPPAVLFRPGFMLRVLRGGGTVERRAA